MTTSFVDGVRVTHWNPRRNGLHYPISRLPLGSRVNNFGDLLGPLIVAKLLQASTEVARTRKSPNRKSTSLVTVGSIAHLARTGDTVWGSGINGKVAPSDHRFEMLDVRAVRGPLTRDFLQARQIPVPEIYGDPGLLVPQLFPHVKALVDQKTRRIGIVPNFHDSHKFRGHEGFIDPQGPLWDVIHAIAKSETIVASSLHGIVIAESLGIPAVPMTGDHEPETKYMDYFLGTGRLGYEPARDLHEAVEKLASGESTTGALSNWDASPLFESFPYDRWL